MSSPLRDYVLEKREYMLRVYDASLRIPCSACGAQIGELCVTSTGWQAANPHLKRKQYGKTIVAREDEQDQNEASAIIRARADYGDILKL